MKAANVRTGWVLAAVLACAALATLAMTKEAFDRAKSTPKPFRFFKFVGTLKRGDAVVWTLTKDFPDENFGGIGSPGGTFGSIAKPEVARIVAKLMQSPARFPEFAPPSELVTLFAYLDFAKEGGLDNGFSEATKAGIATLMGLLQARGYTMSVTMFYYMPLQYVAVAKHNATREEVRIDVDMSEDQYTRYTSVLRKIQDIVKKYKQVPSTFPGPADVADMATLLVCVDFMNRRQFEFPRATMRAAAKLLDAFKQQYSTSVFNTLQYTGGDAAVR